MTISTSTSRSGPYAGAGTTGPFTVGFRFLENSHLRVVKTLLATGVETVLTLSVDYTVTGAGGSGGAVTMTAPVTSDYSITIVRAVPYTQETDYTQSDPFPAQSHEDALDKLTMLAQQLKTSNDRALRVPEEIALPDLPPIASRANMLLAFDSSGNPSVFVPVSGSAADVLTQLANTSDATKGDALIGGKRTTAGALETTQHVVNETREWLPIADFGAVGNGIADDSAAVQLAALTGQSVDLGGRTYRCVTKVTFSVAGTLFRNGTLKFDGANTTRLADITASNVTFQNVTFDGNSKQPRFSLVYVGTAVTRPRFLNCTFQNLLGAAYGSTVLNAMYALNINPYSVVGFEVSGCRFFNLLKPNDGSIVPAAVGLGFVGGIAFLPEDGSDPAAAQPTPSQGIVVACQFDTIKTVLAGGLTDNDVAQYDDGDAIRTYEGTGAKRLYVNISNCTFRKVSKRAVKLRASGGKFSDSTVYASLGTYGMSTVLDLVNGCAASNITILTSSTLPANKAATLSNSGDVTNLPLSFGIDELFCGHAKVGIELTSAGATPMAGMYLRDITLPSISDRAFLTTGTTPSTQRELFIDGFLVGGAGNSCRAIDAGAATDGTGGWQISRAIATNADMKVAGMNNALRDSVISITSTSYSGFSATSSLLEVGSGKGLAGTNKLDGVAIDATGINTGFLTGRSQLALVNSDSTQVRAFSLLVPDGIGVALPHYEGFGDDFHIDGFEYIGPGFCRQGHGVASFRWSVKNAVRKGSGACTTSFWTLNAASQFYEFINVSDFRPTTATSIVSATATNGIAGNVQTRSSNGTPAASGVAKTFNLNTF